MRKRFITGHAEAVRVSDAAFLAGMSPRQGE